MDSLGQSVKRFKKIKEDLVRLQQQHLSRYAKQELSTHETHRPSIDSSTSREPKHLISSETIPESPIVQATTKKSKFQQQLSDNNLTAQHTPVSNNTENKLVNLKRRTLYQINQLINQKQELLSKIQDSLNASNCSRISTSSIKPRQSLDLKPPDVISIHKDRKKKRNLLAILRPDLNSKEHTLEQKKPQTANNIIIIRNKDAPIDGKIVSIKENKADLKTISKPTKGIGKML